MKYVSEREILEELRQLVKERQSARKVARELGINPGRISEYLNGVRRINKRTIERMGYNPTPYYRTKP